MNWRKPLAFALLSVTRPAFPKYAAEFKRVESMSQSQLREFQQDRLAKLVRHAYRTVPYYHEVLSDSGVINNGVVHLNRFSDVPLLTKTELRNQRAELKSKDPGSKVYSNTSGGTTGEPVEFLQDDEHLTRGNATRIYYHRMAGRELGDPWVKLWGNESEVLEEREGIKSRVSNLVLNRHVLNSYRMGELEMTEYVDRINDIQPNTMEVYVESINELAKYIEERNLSVYSPNSILSTAGTLHPPVRERVERVFDTTVLNKYGSREVGDMACECPHKAGLHIFDHIHYVEVVDQNGNPLPPGKEGELAVTVLTNYTMPLIRYRIGDMGVMKEGQCNCGRPFSLLQGVTGRVTDHFLTTDGKLVYGALFRHLLFHKSWIKKFQVQQTAQDRVLYRIVLNSGQSPPQSEMDEIESKTKDSLGENVMVDFEFLESIQASNSGKYRYTISDAVEE